MTALSLPQQSVRSGSDGFVRMDRGPREAPHRLLPLGLLCGHLTSETAYITIMRLRTNVF